MTMKKLTTDDTETFTYSDDVLASFQQQADDFEQAVREAEAALAES